MAAHGWGKDGSLNDWLYEEGYRFDFFQAVKLLEIQGRSSQPERTAVGEGAEPAREAVRFKSAVGLAFPASDVAEVRKPTEEGGAAQMTVNFMGLAGALGPLQTPTTEQILDRARSRDTALRDFLDIFNHRLVSLLYRIRKVHRVGQEEAPAGRDRFSALAYSTFGMGTPHLRGRMRVKDRALLLYAGLLGQQPRSLAGLERILSDYFRVPVAGRPFQGGWINLEEEQWTAIGARGRNNRLGEGAVLGKRVWDQHGAFELCLGPLSLEEFREFLPTGWGFAPLCDLVRFYVGDELGFSVRLKLKAEEMPGARLSAKGGARLGWTSWLKHADWPEDDLRLSEVQGPFCHLRAVGSSEDDSQVSVSPASLRAFAVGVPAATRSPDFALPPDKLAELEGLMKLHSIKANRTVVRQGATGCSMFIIRSGSVRISRREADGREAHVATLREGEFFGEQSIITGKGRNATAVTLRACELHELSKADVDDFVKKYPRFGATLRAYAEGRK